MQTGAKTYPSGLSSPQSLFQGAQARSSAYWVIIISIYATDNRISTWLTDWTIWIQVLHKPICEIAAQYGVSIHLYADDTQLYVSCDQKDADSAMSHMEAFIKEIHQWMHINPLKLNNSKTEFLTLGSRHLLLSQLDMGILEDR